ncbi:MAG: aspartate aminotransferase family protein [Acidovorax sp.]|uniref:aspartate aminotransferase family protein n=1 Tax=Acidovorax sp. TaxID=1872122 RepID=UPI00391D7B33
MTQAVLSKPHADPMGEHLVPGSNISNPVMIEGCACEVTDSEGRTYLDLEAGPGVVSVGHCHPRVVSAIREQAGKLLQGPGRYYSTLTSGLAGRIAALSDNRLSRVFFANSGAEANEGAIKLSFKHATKTHRQGYGVIALEHGFHGRLSLPLSLTGNAARKKGFGPYSAFPGIVHAPAPYFYRSGAKNELDFGAACARSLEDAIKTRAAGEIVTMIAEPIICVGGVFIPPANYWPEVQEFCRKHRITLIFDEVFSGWGRTGRMFAHEHWDLEPDAVTFAKAIGGGVPLGGFMATETLGTAFDEGDHFTTFGSNNQIGMAAGHAVLDILAEERLADQAAEMGKRFVAGLKQLAITHKAIGDVRGLGLMIGVEFVKDRETKEPHPALTAYVQKTLRARGVLVSTTGVHGCVLRLTPPLVITADQIDHAIAEIDAVLHGAANV